MKETLSNMALLIDADNTPINLIEEILAKAESFGQIGIKKIYGNWGSNHLKNWQSMILEHAIIPVHQFAYTKGKNATDISMVIDAMDLMLENNYDGFCLVSSDSDFTPLAARLRANKIRVFGFGKPNTPDSFQKACDEFICFESKNTTKNLSPTPKKTENQVTPDKKSIPNKVGNLVFVAIDKTLEQNGWAKIESIASYINEKDKSFDYKKYGFDQFLSFLQSFPKVEIKKQGNTYFCQRKKSIPTNSIVATKKSIPQKIKQLILEAIKQNADENGWIDIGRVGNCIRSMDSTFSSKLYGFAKLSSLLKSISDITVKKEGNVYFCSVKNAPRNTKEQPIPQQIKELILEAIVKNADETGWSQIGVVNLYVKKADSTFSSELYGFDKISSLLKALPEVEIKIRSDFSLCRQKDLTKNSNHKKIPSNITELILKAIVENVDETGWVKNESILDYVKNAAPNFHHELYGFSKLSQLLESIPEIEVKNNECSSICRIKNTNSLSAKNTQLKSEKKEILPDSSSQKNLAPQFEQKKIIETIVVLLKNSSHKKGWVALSKIENHFKDLNQDLKREEIISLLARLSNIQCLEMPKYSEKREKYYREIPLLKLIGQLKRVTQRTDINIRDSNGAILACALGKYAHFHVYYGKYGFESFPQFFEKVTDYYKRKKEKTNAAQS